MTITSRQGWAFALAITVFFAIAGTIGAPTARAADGTYTFTDWAVPNPLRGDTTRTLITVDTSDHNGETCTVLVDTVNGESVHAENYITVEGGFPTITVTGTEDGAFGEHQNTSQVTLGDSLRVVNHFSLATSVNGRITITCNTTTTTTSVSSTTTTRPVSTTTPPSTSTTSNSTTSTQPPAPPTTAPTPPTTYVIVDEPPGTVTIPPVTSPPTLPYTGPADHLEVLAGLAVAGMAAGTVVLYLAGARGRHEA